MTIDIAGRERPSIWTAMARGLQRRCPSCGRGASLQGYLKVREACAACGEALGHIRADDFPPYATIVVVGHIVVPLMLVAERAWAPPLWLQIGLWPATAGALTLLLLPAIKGAILGLMWSHGLSGDETQ